MSLRAGGSYLSSNDQLLHFGLGVRNGDEPSAYSLAQWVSRS